MMNESVSTRSPASAIVPAVFSNRAQAEAAIADLRALGLQSDQLGVAVPDPVYHQLIEHEDTVGQEELKGAAAGFFLGAPVGSIAGMALIALAAGGLGPLGLTGILIGAGAMWGMVLGAEVGLAARVHSEEEEPHWSEIPLSHTDILVVARAGEQARAAQAVMVRHEGECFCPLDRIERSAA
jgi:hypothetical protein